MPRLPHARWARQGPDLANAGAGGLEMKEKFGTWRSPNITPDKGTGIGNWTDDQIAAAIREGVRPDGAKLSPMMPYMNYNVHDRRRRQSASSRSCARSSRSSARSPRASSRWPPMPAPKPANQAPGDDPLKQGEYMASIMLCNHCHWTPNKEFTAPAGPDKMFSGGLPMELPPLGTGTLFASNITSDPETGIGKWTEEQIYTALKTMQKPDGKMIQGPMLFMQCGVEPDRGQGPQERRGVHQEAAAGEEQGSEVDVQAARRSSAGRGWSTGSACAGGIGSRR